MFFKYPGKKFISQRIVYINNNEKLLFTVISCLMSVSLWADKVVVFETDPYGYYICVIPLVFHEDGVTFSVFGTPSGGGFSYYNDENSFISTHEGWIKKVVIERPTCDFVFSTGNHVTEGQSIVWTGDANTVFLCPVDSRACTGRVIVTVSDSTQMQDAETTLIAIYQNGLYNYCKTLNDEYLLLYGDLQNTFANGDTIQGQITQSQYGNDYEYVPQGAWRLVGHGPMVQPTHASIEMLSPEMLYHYLCFENVAIDFNLGLNSYLMSDDTGDLLLFNRFGIAVTYPMHPDIEVENEINIATINTLIDHILSGNVNAASTSQRYDVQGFLTQYWDKLELIPTSIVYRGLPPTDDYNQDSEVNIADVNALIEFILNRNW